VRAAVILVVAGAAGAQQLSPAFDAASIKQNRSAPDGNGGGRIRPGGRVSMTNVTVRLMIEMAYGLWDYQLTGGPAWTRTIGYDVEAKPESAVDPKTARFDAAKSIGRTIQAESAS
jgi:uncharacterized protein (TIGR03435 family)